VVTIMIDHKFNGENDVATIIIDHKSNGDFNSYIMMWLQ
jgi:hypothetical protein